MVNITIPAAHIGVIIRQTFASSTPTDPAFYS